MSTLAAKIRFQWPNARSPESFIAGADQLHYWNAVELGPEPTPAQLDAIVVPPQATTDWVAFRQAVVQSASFKRIVEMDLVVFTLLNSVMWLIASDPSKAIETVQYWNQLAALAEPTAEEIAELNAIAAEHHVPFVLDEDGMM
jgi:hypothetical protein